MPGRTKRRTPRARSEAKEAPGRGHDPAATTAANSALEYMAVAALTVGALAVLLLAPEAAALLLLCWSPSSWWPLLLAAAWLCWDRHTPHTGGRRMWLHKLFPLWRHAQSYFPVRVVMADGARFEAGCNYILDLHPHPIHPVAMAVALWGGLLRRAFPAGFDFRLVTISGLFRPPVLREIVLALGGIPNSERGLRHVLRGGAGGGQVVVLYSGGVQEALHLRADAFHVDLRGRGFYRLALLEGAAIVPALMLGENLSLRQPAALQAWLLRELGLAVAMPMGRGLFQEHLGVLPHRQPHTLVVGAPLPVPRTDRPSRLQVEALYQQHAAALRKLYAEFSPKYVEPDLPLEINAFE
ncbi:hypothetical protein ONE63_002709 [Megalurothrips usitatus]|uniref:Acyltransferase n=1 Tax=Megalurothrips usitatus TaxID=439358 RepID=A0AAV7XC15_9NEOP|nr:hypothetical protein ONE63_002709 [Megalurothrips usitatus]